MNVTDSTINGNTYSVYSTSSSTNTITNSTLKASTGVYANGTGTLNIIDTDINGSININNSSQIVKIDVSNKSYVNIGSVYNKGNTTINKVKINYNITGDNSSTLNVIANDGILKLNDSEITYTSTSRWYNSERRAIYNAGNLTSKNNKYTLSYSRQNGYIQEYLFGIYNTSILSSINDTIDIKDSSRGYGIYNNSVHDNTITNANIKIHNTYEYNYSVLTEKSTLTLDGITIESYDNTNNNSNVNRSYGIYGNPSSIVVARNVNIGLHDNKESYGIYLNNSDITLESGQIDSRGITAYGVGISTGTYTQGIYDGSGTDSADVSTNNPNISATGTTSGIGVSMGNGSMKYYDGIITGSTSAFAQGDIVSETEPRYHVEFTDNGKSCTLKFDM